MAFRVAPETTVRSPPDRAPTTGGDATATLDVATLDVPVSSPADALTTEARATTPGAETPAASPLAAPSRQTTISRVPQAHPAAGDAALLGRIESTLASYRQGNTLELPPALIEDMGLLVQTQRDLLDELSTATAEQRTALEARLVALDPRVATGVRVGRPARAAYVRVPVQAQVRAAVLARLERGPTPRNALASLSNTPAPGVVMATMRAAEARGTTPSGVTETAWVEAKALRDHGITAADLESFMAVGQLPDRVDASDQRIDTGAQRLDALLRDAQTGSWPAVNAVTFLMNAKVSASRAESAQIRTQLTSSPADAPMRPQLQAIVTQAAETERAIGRDLNQLYAIATQGRAAPALQALDQANRDVQRARDLRAKGDVAGAVRLERRAIGTRDEAQRPLSEEAEYAGQFRSLRPQAGGMREASAHADFGSARLLTGHMVEGHEALSARPLGYIERGSQSTRQAAALGVPRSRILALDHMRLNVLADYHGAYVQVLGEREKDGPRSTVALEHVTARAEAWYQTLGVITERLSLMGAVRDVEAAQLHAERASTSLELARPMVGLISQRDAGTTPSRIVQDTQAHSAVLARHGMQVTPEQQARGLIASADTSLTEAGRIVIAATPRGRGSRELIGTGVQVLSSTNDALSFLRSMGELPVTKPVMLAQAPQVFDALNLHRTALELGSRERTSLAHAQGLLHASLAPSAAAYDPRQSYVWLRDAQDLARVDLDPKRVGSRTPQLDVTAGVGVEAVNSLNVMNASFERYDRAGLATSDLAQLPRAFYDMGLTLSERSIPDRPDVVAAREQIAAMDSPLSLTPPDRLPALLAGSLGMPEAELQRALAPDVTENINRSGEAVGDLASWVTRDIQVGSLSPGRLEAITDLINARDPQSRRDAIDGIAAMAAAASQRQDVSGLAVARAMLNVLASDTTDRTRVQSSLVEGSYQLQIGNGGGAATAFSDARARAAALTNPDERQGARLATYIGETNAMFVRIADGGGPAERTGWAMRIRDLRREAADSGLPRGAVARIMLMEAQALLTASQASEASATLAELEKLEDVPWVKNRLTEFRTANTDGGATAGLQVFLREATSESQGEALAYTGAGAVGGAAVGVWFFGIGAVPGAALGALYGAAAGNLALITRNTVRALPEIVDAGSTGLNNITARESLISGGALLINTLGSVAGPAAGFTRVGGTGLRLMLTAETPLLLRREIGGAIYDRALRFGGPAMVAAPAVAIGGPLALQTYDIATSGMTDPEKALAYGRVRDEFGASAPGLGAMLGFGIALGAARRSFRPQPAAIADVHAGVLTRPDAIPPVVEPLIEPAAGSLVDRTPGPVVGAATTEPFAEPVQSAAPPTLTEQLPAHEVVEARLAAITGRAATPRVSSGWTITGRAPATWLRQLSPYTCMPTAIANAVVALGGVVDSAAFGRLIAKVSTSTSGTNATAAISELADAGVAFREIKPREAPATMMDKPRFAPGELWDALDQGLKNDEVIVGGVEFRRYNGRPGKHAITVTAIAEDARGARRVQIVDPEVGTFWMDFDGFSRALDHRGMHAVRLTTPPAQASTPFLSDSRGVEVPRATLREHRHNALEQFKLDEEIGTFDDATWAAVFGAEAVPVNGLQIMRTEGFADFARGNPARAALLLQTNEMFPLFVHDFKRLVREQPGAPGLNAAAALAEAYLPSIEPHATVDGYAVITRRPVAADAPETILFRRDSTLADFPDVLLMPTSAALDPPGAFAGRGIGPIKGYSRSGFVNRRTIPAEKIVVDGKPLENLDGVLVFAGHGTPTGISQMAPAATANVIADAIAGQPRGQIRVVALFACSQRDARFGFFGRSSGQRIRAAVQAELRRRGLPPVEVVAADQPGILQADEHYTQIMSRPAPDFPSRRVGPTMPVRYTPATSARPNRQIFSEADAAKRGLLVLGALGALYAGIGIYNLGDESDIASTREPTPLP